MEQFRSRNSSEINSSGIFSPSLFWRWDEYTVLRKYRDKIEGVIVDKTRNKQKETYAELVPDVQVLELSYSSKKT